MISPRPDRSLSPEPRGAFISRGIRPRVGCRSLGRSGGPALHLQARGLAPWGLVPARGDVTPGGEGVPDQDTPFQSGLPPSPQGQTKPPNPGFFWCPDFGRQDRVRKSVNTCGPGPSRVYRGPGRIRQPGGTVQGSCGRDERAGGLYRLNSELFPEIPIPWKLPQSAHPVLPEPLPSHLPLQPLGLGQPRGLQGLH